MMKTRTANRVMDDSLDLKVTATVEVLECCLWTLVMVTRMAHQPGILLSFSETFIATCE